MKKLTITATDTTGLGITTTVENNGFSSMEVVGILEQTKMTVLKKSDGGSVPSMSDLLGRMSKPGFNIEDLLGGLPRGIKGPQDDED